ncbi:DUF2997 domain-containing protein (plasmid) [Paenibacillus rhizovicinus]|uniref:DUF2997 domain-containing protein n=1 Tax=Paenibacillus rhizovicinus TaxID=2704463 RepID=A0A6C0PB46_9BACL|nr:DUF2997 domain-containing protein [Paenibacillus rhizovicinus]QHW35767.1 DUF2997 domain-containing protein [Paenibacillus rhizovicinus]
MEQQQVKFTIGKAGGIKFEAMNVQGQACTVVTRDIELHLSRTNAVVSEGKKPEFYEDGPNTEVFNSLND